MPIRPCLRLAGLLLLVLAQAQAAAYVGKPITYYQPDGTPVPVRLYGNEFWAVAETLGGFSVVRDPADRRLCYARLSADGTALLASGMAAEGPVPAGLVRHLRPDAASARMRARERRTAMGLDARGRLTTAMRAWLRGGGARPAAGLVGSGASLRAAAPAAAPRSSPPLSTTIGRRCGVLLLAAFPDRPADVSYTAEQVDGFANDLDYTGFGNATSVRGYFAIQSEGRLDYVNSVAAYFTAAHPRGYYADASVDFGTRAQELIGEGLAALGAQGFDFARGDANGDGVLDAVNLLYAGECPSDWSEGLWPHQWTSTWSGMPAGLSRNFSYQISDMPPGGLPIGTFCHESGHLIADFPDLYPYDDNPAEVGDFCLMSSGNTGDDGFHPTNVCGYLKLAAGWGTVIDLAVSDHLVGAALASRNLFWRFRNPSLPDEYFLLESRSPITGYEGPYGGSAVAVAPARGLLIFQCREDGSNTESTIRRVATPDCSLPYELLLVESQRTDANFFTRPAPDARDGFRADGTDAVTAANDDSAPSLRFWSAHGRTTASGFAVHDIGSSAPAMSFVVGAGTVTGAAMLAVSHPTGLAVTVDAGHDAAPQELLVWNRGGGGALASSLTVDQPWLAVPAAPSADGRLALTFATAALAPGIHSAILEIALAGAADTPVQVPVTLTVAAAPSLVVTPATVAMGGMMGAATMNGIAFLRNVGGGTARYAVASDALWLSVGRSDGSLAGEVDAIPYAVSTAGLGAGIYSGRISVGDGTSTAAVTVALTLTTPVTDDGATGDAAATGTGGGGGGCGLGGMAVLMALAAGAGRFRRQRR